MVPALLEEKKLAFLHIPKCAGTSIHEVLVKYFNESEICPERLRDLDCKPRGLFVQYRFFSGHFTAASLDKISDNKFSFTVLRNPNDRIVSLYYFWRRHSDEIIETEDLVGGRVARSVSGLKEFLSLDAPVPRNHIRNEMTRALAGNIYTEKYDRYYEINNGKRVPIEKFEIVRRAVQTLNSFDFILLVDNIEQDFKKLCEILGIEQAPDLPRTNTRDEVRQNLEPVEEEELDEEHMRLLNSHTDLDRIIYSIARVRRTDLYRRKVVLVGK